MDLFYEKWKLFKIKMYLVVSTVPYLCLVLLTIFNIIKKNNITGCIIVKKG